MPSAVSLVFVGKLVAFVALAYYLSIGRTPSVRGIVACIALMIGALGFYEGFTLAVREESRSRDGEVVPGVVVEMMASDGHGRTYTRDGREGPRAGGSGFLIYQGLARLMATGSARTRMVDYRYPCRIDRGTCFGRDYVGPELWAKLNVGGMVNVRHAEEETGSARLDENPQGIVALGDMGIAAVFLAAAGLLSGRLKPLRGRPYLFAPAVVTSVERVNYRDTIRWKVRFAYFDRSGDAQESADEVNQAIWKPGDDCVAVYQPQEPDLATLQPTVVRDQGVSVSGAQ